MNRLALFSFSVALAVACIGQQRAEDDIVARLLPDHNPQRVPDLRPADKSKAIERLQLAQKRATGVRSQEVAFLLAAYDSDYERNRDYLIHTLRGCATPSIKFGCEDNTGALLIALYERGHKEVLKPLMLYGKDSYNASLAELVGDFYSRVLANNPTEFLETIRDMTPRAQKRLCELAGAADGSGMAPKDLQQVRKKLRATRDDLALRCLRAVESANRSD